MNHNHDVDIQRAGDNTWSVRCHYCGQVFEAKRHDAAFCSPRCRLANHREPQKRANFIEYLGSVGNQARDGAANYSRSKDVYEAMVKLQRDIAVALAQFEN